MTRAPPPPLATKERTKSRRKPRRRVDVVQAAHRRERRRSWQGTNSSLPSAATFFENLVNQSKVTFNLVALAAFRIAALGVGDPRH